MLPRKAAPQVNPVEIQPRRRYENLIAGDWVPPRSGRYLENVGVFTGLPTAAIPCSTTEDVDLALRAAGKARELWKQAAPSWRATALHQVADRMEANAQLLGIAEARETGRPLSENLSVLLAIDHFRYFATRLREDGHVPGSTRLDRPAPPGSPGSRGLNPNRYPLLMAAWQLAPALAAGNCVVLKPSGPTPASVLLLADLIRDLFPPGVLNIVNGYGLQPPPEDML